MLMALSHIKPVMMKGMYHRSSHFNLYVEGKLPESSHDASCPMLGINSSPHNHIFLLRNLRWLISLE